MIAFLSAQQPGDTLRRRNILSMTCDALRPLSSLTGEPLTLPAYTSGHPSPGDSGVSDKRVAVPYAPMGLPSSSTSR